MRNKHPARRKRRILRHILLLALLGAAGALGWYYLTPLLSDTQVPTYASYTVQRGHIATDKSFSASISVLHSETLQNTSNATAIRELYVEAGQEVRKGDKLMLLDNGETLKASLDGVVNSIRFDTTDWLWRNVELIQICDLTHLQVSLSVDEYDVRNVTIGQPCTVTIIPLGLDFETEIAHVDRVSASSGQVAYYTATAELTVPENVLPGMTASVTIPAESANDVLLLEMAALAFDEEKNPYVLQKNGDDYVQIPVTTGLSDGMKVEILSGLQEGDTVWAVSGAETVASSFSLTEVYKQLVGEKIVINDMTENISRGNNRTSAMPQGMMGMGFASPTDMEGASMFENFPQMQEGNEAFPGSRMPDASQSERDASAQRRAQPQDTPATGTDMPVRRDQERKNPQ